MKDSTKKPDAIDPRDLPALLSAVMKHPGTPSDIYNALGEALTDMSNEIDYHTPEMVGRTLAAYAEREAKRKGGAR
jgi:hypothetical protein